MLRIQRYKTCFTLIGVVAMGIGTAQAHQMLYDQDGYRLAVGVEAGLGGFLVGNVDTGAGNINTDAPLQGPFPVGCGYWSYVSAFPEDKSEVSHLSQFHLLSATGSV